MANFTTALTNSGAAAGTFYYNLVFTHDQIAFGPIPPVEFKGYPTVVFLDENGDVVATAGKNEVDPIVAVSVNATKSAYALLGIPDPGDYGPLSDAIKVPYLLVTAPVGHIPQVVSFTATPLQVLAAHPGHASAITLAEL